VKVSIVTTNARAPSDQFVLHAKALPGNPNNGHTLKAVIEGRRSSLATPSNGSSSIKDSGHGLEKPLSVYISGQIRGVLGTIKREPRHRSAVEPIIGQ
jgi:transposase, IS5 family